MNIFALLGYMMLLTAAISFFVAFIIQALYTIIARFEKGTKTELAPELPTVNLDTVQKEAKSQNLEGEINAAIALAIHLYTKNIHDVENMKITIQKTMKPYSPWNSKIYNVTPWRR